MEMGFNFRIKGWRFDIRAVVAWKGPTANFFIGIGPAGKQEE